MSTTSRLRTLLSLSRAEHGVLACALMLLPLAALGLKTIGLRRTHRLLARTRRPVPRRVLAPQRVARLVEIAARRGPFRAKCLPTSLTLQALLAANGTASELRIGVRKRGTKFEAHAWIEHDGLALMEPEGVHERFSSFNCAIGGSEGAAR
jgi:hypothetical protein